MRTEVKYSGLRDRQVKISEQEAKDLRMLHDDFDSDWQTGDEPHGTMTFTDEPAPVSPSEPSEIDLIKADIDDLKARIEKLEKIKVFSV